MKPESNEDLVSVAEEQEPRQPKKTWVTPIVSESPVNEVTGAGTFPGTVPDGLTPYS